MESKWIKPIGVEHQKYPLSGLDLIFGFSYTDSVRFWRKGHDINALEPALQKAINHIPVLAGKVVRENGLLLIDTNGPGVQLTFARMEYKAPVLDNDISSDSAEVLLNPVPSLMNSDISEMPLLTIKATSFSDGIISIGIRLNHIGMDGVAAFMFFRTWMACIEDAELNPVDFSRDAIASLAKPGVNTPSAQSGILANEAGVLPPSPVFFQNKFHSIKVSATDFGRLKNTIKTKFEGGFSINDMLHALVFKAYGLSNSANDAELARINLSYNLRFVKGIELPQNFFGSAILFRCLELSFGELRAIDLVDLARRFKQFSKANPEVCAQDTGFYQAQYEQGNYNKFGVYSNFTTVIGNGGLYLNNALPIVDLPPEEANFEEYLIRSEMVLPKTFAVRLAMLVPSMNKEVILRVALEAYQIPAFEASWLELASQILEASPAALAG